MAKVLIPLTLEQHHKVLYEILYMVDDFCRIHKINYFLIGGSALGAVRHKRIIPWDDDIDIGMTRSNYDRFISKFHSDTPDGYQLYDFDNREDYPLQFAKVTKTDTWRDETYTHKIYVDLFPIDGCGNELSAAINHFTEIRREICDIRRFFTRKFSDNYNCWKSKLNYLVRVFPKDLIKYYPIKYSPHKRAALMKSVYDKCLKYQVEDCKYSACITGGQYGKGEVQPSESFLHPVKMQFGSRFIPIPSNWDAYLTSLYGDYMSPPPAAKRISHFNVQTCIVANK